MGANQLDEACGAHPRDGTFRRYRTGGGLHVSTHPSGGLDVHRRSSIHTQRPRAGDGARELAPDVYGVPACWPHVAAAYERAGFAHTGHSEVVFVAVVDELPRPGPPPIDGLEIHRELEAHATAFVATLAGERVGYVEVTSDVTGGGTLSRLAGWADVWNVQVAEPYRRRRVATWLLAHAADWLRLARAERLLAECWETDEGALGFLRSSGFRELTRTRRGWVRERR